MNEVFRCDAGPYLDASGNSLVVERQDAGDAWEERKRQIRAAVEARQRLAQKQDGALALREPTESQRDDASESPLAKAYRERAERQEQRLRQTNDSTEAVKPGPIAEESPLAKAYRERAERQRRGG